LDLACIKESRCGALIPVLVRTGVAALLFALFLISTTQSTFLLCAANKGVRGHRRVVNAVADELNFGEIK
jgi:hypothetical protein